jgi:hypothetical protein
MSLKAAPKVHRTRHSSKPSSVLSAPSKLHRVACCSLRLTRGVPPDWNLGGRLRGRHFCCPRCAPNRARRPTTTRCGEHSRRRWRGLLRGRPRAPATAKPPARLRWRQAKPHGVRHQLGASHGRQGTPARQAGLRSGVGLGAVSGMGRWCRHGVAVRDRRVHNGAQQHALWDVGADICEALLVVGRGPKNAC